MSTGYSTIRQRVKEYCTAVTGSGRWIDDHQKKQ